MNLFLTATETANPLLMVGYFGFFIVIVYFLIIKPQQKEKKKQQELMEQLAIGDGVLTTAGFYGVIIDMTPDLVIVEFGNNKNCRITMQKQAIVKCEKPNYVEPNNN